MDRRALWIVAWTLFVAVATLFPFNLAIHAFAANRSQMLGFSVSQLSDVPDVVLNILLFIPLGVLVQSGQRRCSRWSNRVIAAGVLALLISLLVEQLQAYLPSRDSSLVDVGANTTGALVGAVAYRAVGAEVVAGVARLRAGASPAKLAAAMVAFTVAALVTSAALQRRSQLSNWSADYPLLVSNEATGDRPWRGRIGLIELTDESTPPDAMRSFASGASPVLAGKRLVYFDFHGASPYSDVTGNVSQLEWTARPSHASPTAEGLRLAGQPWLQTRGDAGALVRRIRASNAFTLRVVCATDDVNQRGPARIVSNSVDNAKRNFTVGQRDRDLVFRFRTPHTGENGFRPEVVIPGVFADRDSRDILFTYDGATLLIAIAKADEVHRIDLTPGSSLATSWAADMVASYLNAPPEYVHADHLRSYMLAYIGGLSALAGLLVAFLGRTRRERLTFSLLWLFAFPLLLEATLALTSGRSFHAGNLELYALVSGMVAPIVALVVPMLDLPRHGSSMVRARLVP